MNRNSIFKSLASLVVLALVFSQVTLAKAAKINFGGETADHFWDIEIARFCKDGFIVSATETNHFGDPSMIGDELAFSLQLGLSDPPVKDSLPAQIAGWDGTNTPHSLVSGSKTFFYNTLQSANTMATVRLERWDHGLVTSDESLDEENVSDGSTFDDNIDITTQPIEDCLIDSVAPSITITSPQAQNYLQTAIVPTTWDVQDDPSGSGFATGSDSGTVDSTSVTNGQNFDLFNLLPGQHTLTVDAADNSGNQAQATISFNVVITIDSLISTTQRTCSMGWISKRSVCKNLNEILIEAGLALKHGNTSDAREKLTEYIRKLDGQKGKSVSLNAYNLLKADAKYIISTLPPSKGDDHH